MTTCRVLEGDCLATMRELPDGVARTCVTSPPYWGLRDYGVDGQIGLEETPEVFVAHLVDVFREVRRVLADDGTCWVNLGDSYAANRSYQVRDNKHTDVGNTMSSAVPDGLKPKDLVGVPWRVAFALQADGWYLRSEIIWAKPNPMPESVTDRPTKAHEQVFLLSKSAKYFYDADAVREPVAGEFLSSGVRNPRFGRPGGMLPNEANNAQPKNVARDERGENTMVRFSGIDADGKRNRRTVWTIPTAPYAEAHFATYPPALVEPCILAGSARGDVVLDPFCGSGTTGMVALRHGRGFIGCELSPTYAAMARRRIFDDAPLLNRLAMGAV